MTLRAALNASMTEKQFMAAVLGLARYRGWRTYHTYRSDRSAYGFPDCVFVRPPRLIFAELKSERGKVSAAQTGWLEALNECTEQVEVYVWRPSDYPWIEQALR